MGGNELKMASVMKTTEVECQAPTGRIVGVAPLSLLLHMFEVFPNEKAKCIQQKISTDEGRERTCP